MKAKKQRARSIMSFQMILDPKAKQIKEEKVHNI